MPYHAKSTSAIEKNECKAIRPIMTNDFQLQKKLKSDVGIPRSQPIKISEQQTGKPTSQAKKLVYNA